MEPRIGHLAMHHLVSTIAPSQIARTPVERLTALWCETGTPHINLRATAYALHLSVELNGFIVFVVRSNRVLPR